MRELIELVRSDIARYRIYGWAMLHQQGLWAGIDYRFGYWARHDAPAMLRPSLTVISLIMRKLIEVITGICISPNARIGRGFHINHFGGIFINSGAQIGEQCGITHGVAIGTDERGGVPSIGNNVKIGAGATIFGAIHVGNNARIGAGAVVFTDVPEGATAVGVPPARIIIHADSDREQ